MVCWRLGVAVLLGGFAGDLELQFCLVGLLETWSCSFAWWVCWRLGVAVLLGGFAGDLELQFCLVGLLETWSCSFAWWVCWRLGVAVLLGGFASIQCSAHVLPLSSFVSDILFC